MGIASSKTQPPAVKANAQMEVEYVKCHSCGFIEECTLAYISKICQRYSGRWICSLCIEAMKDEILRSDKIISTEEALNRHIDFLKNFQSSSPLSSPSKHPIVAMGRLLRRSLDSPRALQSIASSPLRDIDGPFPLRSESCFSLLSP